MKKLLLALLLCLPLAASADGYVDTLSYLASGGGGGGSETFTFVGAMYGATDGSSTTVSATGSVSIISGDLIIVGAQWEDNASAEVTLIQDDSNANGVGTKDSEIHNAGSFMNLHLWWGIAGTTRTATSFDIDIDTSVAFKKAVVMVYRPSGGTVSKDLTGTPGAADDTDTSDTPTTGSFSTTGSHNVVCGVAGIYTGGNWNDAAPVINAVAADHTTGQSNSGMLMWCDDDSGALSGVTAQADYSADRVWVANAIAFKAE